MNGSLTLGRHGAAGLISAAAVFWALVGGALLLAVVLVNVISIIGGIFGAPFPGDFELTQNGVAVAAFAFLPYTQITGANVTADIFTSKAGPRSVAAMSAVAALVAVLFACLLLWRMSLGMIDQKAYDYTTTIIQLPIWWVFVPILVSLALLALTAIVTFAEAVITLKGGQNG